MLLLIPIGHKDQVVQRLPYVTITIIILNILIFSFTSISTHKSQKIAMEKLQNVLEFITHHPDIDLEKIAANRDFKELSSFFSEAQKHYPTRRSATNLDIEKFNKLLNEYTNAKYLIPHFKYGLIPSRPRVFNFLSSMFMHGGIFHLLFNMLFLWIAGCNIEDKWGRPFYLTFYLICGIIASLAHVLMFPNSNIPLIGASGAIAGAMGAFYIGKSKFLSDILSSRNKDN